MGFTPSSSTQTIYAYLTQKGRTNLLFSSATASKVRYFTLHDDDTNYRVSANNDNKLPTGFIPDITGDDDNCIRSVAQAHIVDENNYLIWGGVLPPLPPEPPPPGGEPPPPGGEPPPPGGEPPPPGVTRTQPLILEFEYPRNYDTTTVGLSSVNDVWVHQRITENITNTKWRSELGQNVKIYNAANPLGTALGNQDPKFAIVLRTSPGDTQPITQAERDALKFNLTIEYATPIPDFYGVVGSQNNNFGYPEECYYVGLTYNEPYLPPLLTTDPNFIRLYLPAADGFTNPIRTKQNYISGYSFGYAVNNKITKMYLFWDEGKIDLAGDPTSRNYFQFKLRLSLPDISATYQVNQNKNEYEYRAAVIRQM
jgi:hypothetical protein